MFSKLSSLINKSVISEKFQKRSNSSNSFAYKFNGGVWLFKMNEKLSLRTGGSIVSYQLTYHLNNLEHISAFFSNAKYSAVSPTGVFGNIGMIFGCNTYEHNLNDNTDVSDVVDDLIFHYQKYIDPFIIKYSTPEAFYDAICSECPLIISSLVNTHFHMAAAHILCAEYEEAKDILKNAPDSIFKAHSRSECLSSIGYVIKQAEVNRMSADKDFIAERHSNRKILTVDDKIVCRRPDEEKLITVFDNLDNYAHIILSDITTGSSIETYCNKHGGLTDIYITNGITSIYHFRAEMTGISDSHDNKIKEIGSGSRIMKIPLKNNINTSSIKKMFLYFLKTTDKDEKYIWCPIHSENVAKGYAAGFLK